jgi:hypothetical protein
VKFASGFAPIKFVSEPFARFFHRIRIYKTHHEMLDTGGSRWGAKCRTATITGLLSHDSPSKGHAIGLTPDNDPPPRFEVQTRVMGNQAVEIV